VADKPREQGTKSASKRAAPKGISGRKRTPLAYDAVARSPSAKPEDSSVSAAASSGAARRPATARRPPRPTPSDLTDACGRCRCHAPAWFVSFNAVLRWTRRTACRVVFFPSSGLTDDRRELQPDRVLLILEQWKLGAFLGFHRYCRCFWQLVRSSSLGLAGLSPCRQYVQGSRFLILN
jgi:hypothetical protein